MKIYLNYNNKFIMLHTKILQYMGEGIEGIVYSYKDIAVKIKHENIVGLNYKNAIKIRDVETKRILVPQSLIYNNTIKSKENYIGYTTQLIISKPKNNILYVKSEVLYNEIQILLNNIENLSKNQIIIYDLDNNENFIFNDKLYFVDPGCYEYLDYLSYNEIRKENVKELGNALLSNVFNVCDDSGFLAEELVTTMSFDKNEINEKLLAEISNIYYEYYYNDYNKNNSNNHAEFILNILDKYGTLKKYKYELLKQYLTTSNKQSDIDKILRKTIK